VFSLGQCRLWDNTALASASTAWDGINAPKLSIRPPALRSRHERLSGTKRVHAGRGHSRRTNVVVREIERCNATGSKKPARNQASQLVLHGGAQVRYRLCEWVHAHTSPSEFDDKSSEVRAERAERASDNATCLQAGHSHSGKAPKHDVGRAPYQLRLCCSLQATVPQAQGTHARRCFEKAA
jgi:hypothetical protein